MFRIILYIDSPAAKSSIHKCAVLGRGRSFSKRRKTPMPISLSNVEMRHWRFLEF